ncbi:MAG: exodeoxyribonuclease VII small subunit [Chloroflexi bacterium]|nr:MAG: exodeoxyribonuclease VII small subunit [Chloroflexota bacterium]TMF37991.1 MAG: exodeoxyribonuclease VII small subunit [Chloroflexota bacterium]
MGRRDPRCFGNRRQPKGGYSARIGQARCPRGRGRGVSQDLTYEQALEKLDDRLKVLEDGNLSLEDALKAVDEARIYLKICTERLEAARKKIEVRGEAESTE